jgi:coenzyme Q-binding protein COQ10
MPRYATMRTLPFAADRMYAVVADVERYPEFLPLCEGLKVNSRTDTGTGTLLTATMTVGFKQIRESFTTEVTLDPAARTIRVTHLDGPFSHLENTWQFEDIPGGSQTRFEIDYEFRSRLLGIVMGQAFNAAVHKYADAFETRARLLSNNEPENGEAS